MQGPPGEQMNYNTGNTHLLPAILTEVSGGNTWTFAEKALAAPLGITLLNAAAILPARPSTLLKPSTAFPSALFEPLLVAESLILGGDDSGDDGLRPTRMIESLSADCVNEVLMKRLLQFC